MWERGERPFCPFCAGAVDQRVADHSRELRGPPGAHWGAWGWRRAPGADSSFLQEHLGKGGARGGSSVAAQELSLDEQSEV